MPRQCYRETEAVRPQDRDQASKAVGWLARIGFNVPINTFLFWYLCVLCAFVVWLIKSTYLVSNIRYFEDYTIVLTYCPTGSTLLQQ